MSYFNTFLFTLLFITACTSATEQTAYQDLNVAQFKAKLNEPNIVVLDVRTPAEVAAGKIPDALEIDIQGADFQQKIDALDKDKTYLVYCKAGGRSARACGAMNDKGFKKLYNLTGGFTAFSASE